MITVEKLGNDLIIRLPREMIKQVRFKAGMELDVDILVDQLQLRRAGTKRRRSKYLLSDLLKKMKSPYPHKNVFNDPPVGKEII